MADPCDFERDRPLFERQVPVLLRATGREETRALLTVRILLGEVVHKQRERLLRVEITDDSNHLFLYTLDVNEADFHELKRDQSLLVDFGAFPSKFIELLEQCLISDSAASSSASSAASTPPRASSSLKNALGRITGLTDCEATPTTALL